MTTEISSRLMLIGLVLALFGGGGALMSFGLGHDIGAGKIPHGAHRPDWYWNDGGSQIHACAGLVPTAVVRSILAALMFCELELSLCPKYAAHRAHSTCCALGVIYRVSLKSSA